MMADLPDEGEVIGEKKTISIYGFYYLLILVGPLQMYDIPHVANLEKNERRILTNYTRC
jgi:hypothetical protein